MDPGSEDVATTKVVALPPQGRGRWALAGFVVVAALAATIAVFLILGAKPLPEAYRYLPADSAVVLELRPELPGDQRQHLGNFLAKFPGFADQSSFSDKLDQVLSRLVGQVTDGQVSYAAQIKPLLAGPMTAGVSADAIAHMADGDRAGRGLLVATTDGTATCDVVFGTSTVSETHRAVAIRSVQHDLSCAVDGRFLLLGDASSVKAGLDASLDHTGLDGSSRFRSARDTLSGDQVGLAYLDGTGLMDAVRDLAPILGTMDGATSMLPDWLILGLRFGDDALELEVRSPRVPSAALASGVPTAAPSATSVFAAMIPADALGFVEAHGAGANIQRAMARLRADADLADTAEQIEGALAAIGGLTNVVGWIEDVGVAGVPIGDSIGAVVLVRGTDAATTAGWLTQIRTLLVLASAGTEITLRDVDHDGTTVTNVDIADLEGVLAALGVAPGALDLGSISGASLALAAREDVLLVGIGEGVVERILDTSESTAIGTTDAYRRTSELAGSKNDFQAYLSLEAILRWAESQLISGADLESWNSDVKPYLEHLAGLGAANITTTTGGRSRLVLTVK